MASSQSFLDTDREAASRLLLLILFIGFLLRIWGIKFGLPFLYHADEPIVVNHALAFGSGDFNPHFFNIPPLVSYLLFIVYGCTYGIAHIAGKFQNPQAMELSFYLNPTLFYTLARFVFGACAGTAGIYFLFILVKKFFSKTAGLIAAALLAVNFLHVRDSHYIYADIPILLAMTFAFHSFFCLLQKPSTKKHLIAGSLIGISTAIKYNGAALVFPYIFILISLWKKTNPYKSGAMAFLGSIICFFLLNPFSVFDFSAFLADIRQQAASNAGVPWLHHLTYSLFGGMDGFSLLLAAAGMLRAFFLRDPKRNALNVFLICYYLILVKSGQPYDRYVLPMIPWLIFFAADFLDFLFTNTRKARAVFGMLFLAGALISSFSKACLSDYLFSALDARTKAREWVLTNLPNDSSIALDWDFFMPRLPVSRTQLLEKKEFLSTAPSFFSAAQTRRLELLLQQNPDPAYKLYYLSDSGGDPKFLFSGPRIPYDLDYLKGKGIEYVLVPRLCPPPGPEDFYELLRSRSVKLMTISPFRDPGLQCPPDARPLTGGPFLWKDLLKRKTNGQAIDIYRLL